VGNSDKTAQIARIDSATLKLRHKLYTFEDKGELNVYGFDEGDIPIYSDSVVALRLSLLETEIPLEYNEQVKAYIELYANRRRGLISKVLTTSKFYFPIFEEVFDRENVPMEFKYLAVIESALNQKAISPVGAAGLWQFMPATGRMYGLRTDNYFDDRKDIIKSTEAAVEYFKNSYRIYNDWLLVIASYNCGPGNVNKAIRKAVEEKAAELNQDGSGNGNELKQIAKEMEQLQKDIVNNQITEESIRRQRDIEIRLLKAEEAERTRDRDNERKSNEARDYPVSNPMKYEEYMRKKQQETELLKTVPPSLKPYYKEKVNSYFIKLGDQ
jgi:hypothetical protein